IDGVKRAIGPVQTIGDRIVLDAGRSVLPLAQKLPGSSVDEDRPTMRPMHEEHAGGKVRHQCMEHAGGAAEVVGQGALFGDVADDALPAKEGLMRVELW